MPPPRDIVDDATLPQLSIPTDKIAFLILKAREFDAKEGLSDPDSGSNPADDGDTDVLEDGPDDTVREEIRDAIIGLNDDQRLELVALAWIGRGTYDVPEWDEALRTARQEHGVRVADYLLEMPLLGDYLEEGLAALGSGIVDEDDTREGLNAENEPLGNMPDKPARQ